MYFVVIPFRCCHTCYVLIFLSFFPSCPPPSSPPLLLPFVMVSFEPQVFRFSCEVDRMVHWDVFLSTTCVLSLCATITSLPLQRLGYFCFFSPAGVCFSSPCGLNQFSPPSALPIPALLPPLSVLQSLSLCPPPPPPFSLGGMFSPLLLSSSLPCFSNGEIGRRRGERMASEAQIFQGDDTSVAWGECFGSACTDLALRGGFVFPGH